MKTLLLLRHAKTEPAAPGGDKKRALTGRGRGDARLMGQRLPAIVKRLDRIITSDARRARQTAKIVAKRASFKKRLRKTSRLYAAGPDTLLRVIQGLPNKVETVLLVGHNPGLEALGAELAGEEALSLHLPTAGLLQLEFEIGRWRDIRPGTGRLAGIYTPKELPPPFPGELDRPVK